MACFLIACEIDQEQLRLQHGHIIRLFLRDVLSDGELQDGMRARRVFIVFGSIVRSLLEALLDDGPCLIAVLHTDFFEVVDDDALDWVLHDV